MKFPISVIVLTYNEEVNLENCLRNIIGFVDDIFIVDSYSNDKTLEISRKYGVKVVQNNFENQAKQFNWALDNLDIKTDWILRLDADEYLTEELKKEIAEVLPKVSSETSGFYIKRRVYFMGQWIKRGGYYPIWLLRLFRKGKARVEQRQVDEHIILLEGMAGKLKNDFIDDNKKDLTWWVNKHNNYASREVEDVINRLTLDKRQQTRLDGQVGRKRWVKDKLYYKLPFFARSFLYFIWRYFFLLGFLDGKNGLVFHFLQGFWYRFLVDAKIYESNLKKVK